MSELRFEHPDAVSLNSLSLAFLQRHTFQIQRDLPTLVRFQTRGIYDVFESDSLLWLRFDWMGSLFIFRADIVDTSELESSRLLRQNLAIVAKLENVEPLSLVLSSKIYGLENPDDGFPPDHAINIDGASGRVFSGRILDYRSLP